MEICIWNEMNELKNKCRVIKHKWFLTGYISNALLATRILLEEQSKNAVGYNDVAWFNSSSGN